MTRRETLAEKAKLWYEYTTETYSEQTRRSVKLTKEYGPELALADFDPSTDRRRKLRNIDSVGCLFDHAANETGKICLFNFASYKNPGGFFLGGSPAQEEALCHESNLYNILLSFDSTYYAWNRKHLNRSLYLDRALYTPDVVFSHDGNEMTCDVLTCAAPNYGSASRYKRVGMAENMELVEQRLKFINTILKENGVDVFICGAWGCGVFEQDPRRMALTMEKTLDVPIIYHPIPGKDYNFEAFYNVLEEGTICGPAHH